MDTVGITILMAIDSEVTTADLTEAWGMEIGVTMAGEMLAGVMDLTETITEEVMAECMVECMEEVMGTDIQDISQTHGMDHTV